MSSVVKQVLALTATSEASQWTQVESAIHPKELSPAEIAQIANHFSSNEQGSEQFWDTLQRATVDKIGKFNREELSSVFQAMMVTPYEIPDEVGESVSAAMNTFFEAEQAKQLRKDPYFLATFVQKVQAGLGQFAFQFGPGFVSGRPNDEVEEKHLAKYDPELSEESNAEIKSGFIQGELTKEEVNHQIKQLHAEISKQLNSNQNAQDIAHLK